MKYIRNISDEQNKVGDTDNVFRLNLFEDDKLFDFGENNLTVNVANSSGYILSLTPKKETGNTVIDLDFNDAPLKSLTPDDYLLEVEVKFSDGTKATFPTKGGMPFTVNGNLKETSGELVPTVTFDNVLAAVDEKIAVYMDTVKVGPQGPVGPAGNVDTSNDNTFTGANTFTKLISGYTKTLVSPNTDVNLIITSGKYEVLNTYKNIPSGIQSAGVMYVETNVDTGVHYQLLQVRGNVSGSDIYFRAGRLGVWQPWEKVAKDSEVLHIVGTKTVAGDTTFTGTTNFTGATTLKTGNYGLRVTTSGIQKTSDGGTTWTNI